MRNPFVQTAPAYILGHTCRSFARQMRSVSPSSYRRCMTVERRQIIIALVVTSFVAVPLTGVAWWALQDGSDTHDWLVRAIRAFAYVVVSKAGLKAILVAVLTVGAGVAWLRSRRRLSDRTDVTMRNP